MSQDRIYKVLWPDARMVSADTLIGWAKDDVANGLHVGPVTTVEEAIAVLNETGTVTLGRS